MQQQIDHLEESLRNAEATLTALIKKNEELRVENQRLREALIWNFLNPDSTGDK